MGIIWLEWKENIKSNAKILDSKLFDGILYSKYLYYHTMLTLIPIQILDKV